MARLTESARLLLRDLRPDDLEPVHRWASDPEALRFMDWGPNPREATLEFLREADAHARERPRAHFELAIVLKDGGRLIGEAQLHVSGPHIREGWVAYLIDRPFQGQGYGAEAVDALVGLGFDAAGLHRIFATVRVDHAASIRVLEKCGFEREGRLRALTFRDGRWHDAFLYAILERRAGPG